MEKSSFDNMTSLREVIVRKNQAFFDSWRAANWSFVYGDRISQRFGKASGKMPSLKESLERRRSMISEMDASIHAIALGKPVEMPLCEEPEPVDLPKALTAEEQLATFAPAEGYKVNLFASERDGVVSPTRFAWDERGRLYVACSPMYPHTREDDGQRSGYIVALQDTDGDGQADKSRFAEPTPFE